MKQLLKGTKQLAVRPTPQWLATVVIFVFMADLAAGFFLGRKTVFPLSKTFMGYVSSMLASLSTWTGVFIWVIFIASLVRPILTGKKPHVRDIKSFTESVLKRIPPALSRIGFSISVLLIECILLAVLLLRLIGVRDPCRPGASPGIIAVRTDCSTPWGTSTFYKAFEEPDKQSTYSKHFVGKFKRDSTISLLLRELL